MKVFIAVPSYKKIKCLPFLDSLESTVKLLMAKGHDVIYKNLVGSCYIQTSRNELVRAFLQTDCDTMFFLDDDLSWSAEDALKLLETPDELVAGVYPMKQKEPRYTAVIRVRQDDTPLVRLDGLISATHVSTGFLKIKRTVIEKLIKAYPQQMYYDFDKDRDQVMYDLFPQGVKDCRWWGEDYAFCNLWLGILGELWVMPNITFKHYGEDGNYWEGNFHEFLKSCPKPEAK